MTLLFPQDLEVRTAAERIARAATHFQGRLLAASEFGADSAVLLHLLSVVAREVPVVFVNTGFHFDETLAFKDKLAARLGLTVREVAPPVDREEFLDRHGPAYEDAPGFCCDRNRIQPLRRALAGASCWISDARRERLPRAGRLAGDVPVLDTSEHGIVRLNPLADWSEDRIGAYLSEHNLPRHPLAAEGYVRIGCRPCSVRPAVDARTGLLSETGAAQPAARPGIASRPVQPPPLPLVHIGADPGYPGTERHAG